MVSPAIAQSEPQLIRIDIGCGPRKQPGHIGLDQIAFDGVDHVINIGQERWPFEDGSVESAHCSHFVEHLTATERIHFCNELYRVLGIGKQAQIIVPHWNSNRAYGDPTHQWPPVSEMWFFYLDRAWRAVNAPHTDKQHWASGFDCHFVVGWGYALHESLHVRSEAYQRFALQNYREAAQDTLATLTKQA